MNINGRKLTGCAVLTQPRPGTWEVHTLFVTPQLSAARRVAQRLRLLKGGVHTLSGLDGRVSGQGHVLDVQIHESRAFCRVISVWSLV